MKFSNVIIALFISLLIFCSGLFYGNRDVEPVIEYRTDTIVLIDTVEIEISKPYRVTEVRTDTLAVYIDRVLNPGDSIPVELPIEEVSYKGDEYDLTIGGYHPYLKSLTVYPRTVQVTNTEIQTVTKRNRFEIGLQAGYGFSGQKFAPYVGVGLQYNLIAF